MIRARTVLFIVVLLVSYHWIGSTLFFIGLAAFALYELLTPPPRYRKFDPEQAQQAVDNRFGIFGRAYREDEPGREARRTGRNDPCPCGSWKKYKHCHLDHAEALDR